MFRLPPLHSNRNRRTDNHNYGENNTERSARRETKDDLVKRYAQMPIAKQTAAPSTNAPGHELSRLETNLRRFEEERRRFQREKERFEREKNQIEQMRFQRLIELERKKTPHRKHTDHQSRPIDTGTIVTPSKKEKLDKVEKIQRFLARSRSKSREREMMESFWLINSSDSSQPILRKRLPSANVAKYGDDYESSTATSSSSRDADFDIDSLEEVNDQTHLLPATTIEQSIADPSPPSVQEAHTLLSRLLFGKRTTHSKPQTVNSQCAQPQKIVQRKPLLIIDDGGPISIKRILFVETPIVWRQVLDDHAIEWEQNKRLRNRCVADFIALALFFGAGGLIFRFVEGAFENFYKCGVKRVKRDFVDQLWTSSHNLRSEFEILTTAAAR